MEPSDQALLEAARRGDRAALETLLERHEARIYRFGMQMCRNPEDAKDVLQETLLAMARGVRDFRGASSLSTWLYAVARSFCVKMRRRGKFDPVREHSLETDAVVAAAQVADPARPADDTVAAREVEHALRQAIAALDPMYREVLLLRDVEGLTAPEVAEVLGVGVDAVKSRLHRARLTVRAQVAPRLGVPAAVATAGAADCPDVLTLFSQHLEGEISASVCDQMERHVAGCPRCRVSCDSLRRTLVLCRTSASVPVPAPVQDAVRAALRQAILN